MDPKPNYMHIGHLQPTNCGESNPSPRPWETSRPTTYKTVDPHKTSDGQEGYSKPKGKMGQVDVEYVTTKRQYNWYNVFMVVTMSWGAFGYGYTNAVIGPTLGKSGRHLDTADI